MAASGSAATKPAASGSIKIGYVNTTTGTGAAGTDNDDAFQLYLDSINSTIAGRKVEVRFADDTGQPDVGLTKARQLVESDKVNFLMGLTFTPICNAVATYAGQSQTPMIVSGNCGAQTMLYDPKTANRYVVRITHNATGVADPLADYAYRKGYRKAILISSDYGGGLEFSDAFGSAFVGRGGAIVQELHPPLGTKDFGPYVSQIGSNADVLVQMLPGVDVVRFLDARSTYGAGSKLPVLDSFGTAISGPNLAQAKDKAAGVIGDYAYSPALDTPAAQALLKAWKTKYPDRPFSNDAANGWSAGQFLEAAIEAVNGNVEDKEALMKAMYGLKVVTAKGPISLDAQHDVIQNIYFWQAEKSGSDMTTKLLETYSNVASDWDRTQDQIAKFKFGSYRGKWVGMTKDQLGDVLTLKS